MCARVCLCVVSDRAPLNATRPLPPTIPSALQTPQHPPLAVAAAGASGAVSVDTSSDSSADSSSAQQQQRSYVDGSNAVSFVKALADDTQARQDVLNIYLLAQLGADKAVPNASVDYTLQVEWFKKYKETYSKFFTYQKWVR